MLRMPRLSCPATRLAKILAIASAAFCIVGPALAAPSSTCGGRNIFDDIKQSDATSFQAIRAAADATENGKGVLWKVEQKDALDRLPSYLFGTMHVTDDRVTAMSPAILKAMNASRRIALEIEDASPQRMLEAMGSFGEKVLLPEGKTLVQLLGATDAKKLALVLTASGVDADVAMRLQPWLAFLLMSYSECERSRIIGGKLTLDGEIARIGEDRGVGVIGLETVETQFLALSEIPEPDQLAILRNGLIMRDRVTDLTETMIQLYLKRDIAAMWPLQSAIGKAAGLQPVALNAFEQSILINRNTKMRDRAAAHLAYGGVFVAVGAAHMPGKTGLISLLRDIGYTVTLVE
jgi:uncharacterized protein